MRDQINESVEKLIYSLKESSAKTGYSLGHLRNEAKRGKLKLVKSGRRTGILAEELKRYLSELSEIDFEVKKI